MASLLLFAVACKKATTQSTEEQAIKQAMGTYLAKKGLNLKSMTVDYKNFQIAGNQATVDVLFQSGQSSDMNIGFKYTLNKDANGWQVVKSEATSGSMFGGHAGGEPASGAAVSGEGQLPPGHPMVAPPPAGGQPVGAMEPAHKETQQKKK